MVDYSKYYYGNVFGTEKKVRKKGKRRGTAIAMLLVVSAFFGTLFYLDSLMGGVISVADAQRKVPTYYVVARCDIDDEIAGNYATTDRNAGGAGVIFDGENCAVLSRAFDTMSQAKMAARDGQIVLPISPKTSISQGLSDIMDLAFMKVHALIALIGCGADGNVILPAVNMCAYELTSEIERADVLDGERIVLDVLTVGIDALRISPCAANANALLVNAVLCLGL